MFYVFALCPWRPRNCDFASGNDFGFLVDGVAVVRCLRTISVMCESAIMSRPIKRCVSVPLRLSVCVSFISSCAVYCTMHVRDPKRTLSCIFFRSRGSRTTQEALAVSKSGSHESTSAVEVGRQQMQHDHTARKSDIGSEAGIEEEWSAADEKEAAVTWKQDVTTKEQVGSSGDM